MSNSELFDIISNQTGINDLLLIEKTYYEYNSDEVRTIYKLLEIELPQVKEKKLTVFDDLRKICDEKDTIFQEIMKKNRENNGGTLPPFEVIQE
jgi:hypothetical protein